MPVTGEVFEHILRFHLRVATAEQVKIRKSIASRPTSVASIHHIPMIPVLAAPGSL